MLPLRVNVPVRRQRLHRRQINFLEHTLPGARALLELFAVEFHQQLPDGIIQLFKTEERPLPEFRENPAAHHLNCRFHYRLVRRFTYPGWNDSQPVVR